MLSTSVLSFSNKLPLSSSSLINDDDDDDNKNFPLRYRSSPGSVHQSRVSHPVAKSQRANGRKRFQSQNGNHVSENSSTTSDSLGSIISSVKVKYLGVISASGRSSAILNKGLTAIQSELVDLYTIAQRKYVTSITNGVHSSSYQMIEVCNYGVVIAEPDPSSRTTLSVAGQSNLTDPNRIVVTKVITPLSNIVLWAGIRFNCRPLKINGRHRSGAAFIPLSCSSAIMKQSAYTPLTNQRSRFLSSLKHPPLFLCVLRKVSAPKIFECHLFACCSVEDAINLSSNLSDVQNGILKVGSPSIPISSDLPSYSFTSFDEIASRTSSRQLSSSATSGDHHHIALNNHRTRNQCPSVLTDRTSRLTVSTDERPATRYSRGSNSSNINNNNNNNRHEVFNYRRELGMRPWPSSVAPKLSESTVNQLRFNGKRNVQPTKSTDQLSHNSSSSFYSLCQACSINGQSVKTEQLKCDSRKNLNHKNDINPIETNNYNGYLVHLNYNDKSNGINHNYTKKTHQIVHNNLPNHKQLMNGHQISPKVPTFSEDESSSILSKFGRRGERLVNCPGVKLKTSPTFRQFLPNSNLNGLSDGLDDDDDDLTCSFPSSELNEGDGLLTFVEEDLLSNPINPPMVQIDKHQLPRWSTIDQPLSVYPLNFHHRTDFKSRIASSSSSNSLFRRLGRWKLRSWVRKSFNLKFRRKKKRNRMDLFVDRDLRYLSLAEPLDYVGGNKLALDGNKRLQLNENDDQGKGHFLGMETINNNNVNYNSRVTLPETIGIIGTQELPEERNGLETLKQLIDRRKNQSNYQIDSLLNTNIKRINNNKTNGKIKSDGRKLKSQSNGDQSLSQIDLINELGYLP
ncbi:homeobox protein 2-like [Panonychus citri]|uniref:homeobox protein 2-like n=1 Tax=Panonychus citri TaxID=50023 RepID=UPI0023080CB8|nr:homeobox protein 2-like [Panonychus citri]